MLNEADKKEFGLALLTCAVFVLAFSILPNSWHGADYAVHYRSAQGELSCLDDACLNQPPLFKLIAGPFAKHSNGFWFFTLFLTAVVLPLSIFLITRKAVTVWFYFTTSYVFYFFIDGLQTQVTALIIIALLLVVKNNYLRFLLFGLSILAHAWAFPLAALVILFSLLNEHRAFAMRVFPACSALFGNNRPDFFNAGLENQALARSLGLYSPANNTISNALNLGYKVMLFPFFFMAVSGLFSRKRWDLFLILTACVLFGFLLSYRVFYMGIPSLLAGLTFFYEAFSWQLKVFLIFGTIFSGLMMLWLFVNFNMVCNSLPFTFELEGF